MKQKNLKQLITIAIVVITLALSIFTTVKATMDYLVDLTKTASLTINKYEYSNSAKTYTAYSGVEFTLYYIANIEDIYNGTKGIIEDATEAMSYIEENSIEKTASGITKNGTITFENLTLGRYLVAETEAPKNVLTKIEPFLIDLPRTSDDGTSLEYDVTVEPKNITYYGDIDLTKYNQDGDVLSDVTFLLQKYVNETWVNYETFDEDYGSYFKTDENGKIELKDLEYGNYRIYEIETQTGYILDSSNIIEFSINETTQNYCFTATNYKPEIEKYVELTNGEYGETTGVNLTDTVSWKIVADVPGIIQKMKTFYIEDNLSSGIVIDENTIKVYGVDETGNKAQISSSNFIQNIENQTLIINFLDKNILTNYKYINIYYNTNFDGTVTNGEFLNSVTLNYTSSISTGGEELKTFSDTDTASSYTGTVLIEKTNPQGEALENAVFKIATSKENAINGIYVKNENGEDLTAISNSNGEVIFSGLSYGGDNINYLEGNTSYWIVETKAPTYEDENGKIKSYALFANPIEVQVNSSSGSKSISTVKVVNKKQYTLPITGGSILLIAIAVILIIIAIIIKIKQKTNKKIFKFNKKKEN